MKSILGNFTVENQAKTTFESLKKNEMQAIRGGAEPIKPKSRPRDVYDLEEE